MVKSTSKPDRLGRIYRLVACHVSPLWQPGQFSPAQTNTDSPGSAQPSSAQPSPNQQSLSACALFV